MLHANGFELRELPLFCNLNETSTSTLMCVGRVRRFPKQVTLGLEGKTPDFLYVVVDGLVELFGTHNGKETTIDIVRPGSALALAAVIREAASLTSARTLVASQILAIPAQVVRDLCERDADFVRAILNDLAERCRGSIRALKNMKLRSGAERLANWILQTDAITGNERRFEMAFDKRILASRLGMTPESLSRNLAMLTKHGVRNSGRDIVIEDAAALMKLATPNALIDE